LGTLSPSIPKADAYATQYTQSIQLILPVMCHQQPITMHWRSVSLLTNQTVAF